MTNKVNVEFLGTKIVDGILMYCNRFSIKLSNKFTIKK